jgi:hypothetical protein
MWPANGPSPLVLRALPKDCVKVRGFGTSATLMEFLSPSTRKPERVHSTSVCLADYVPPSGFPTLSTVFSSPERLALFHASNAHGVLPFRGFPSLLGPVAHRLGNTLLTFFHRTE